MWYYYSFSTIIMIQSNMPGDLKGGYHVEIHTFFTEPWLSKGICAMCSVNPIHAGVTQESLWRKYVACNFEGFPPGNIVHCLGCWYFITSVETSWWNKTPTDSRKPKPGYQWKIGMQIGCCTWSVGAVRLSFNPNFYMLILDLGRKGYLNDGDRPARWGLDFGRLSSSLLRFGRNSVAWS